MKGENAARSYPVEFRERKSNADADKKREPQDFYSTCDEIAKECIIHVDLEWIPKHRARASSSLNN